MASGEGSGHQEALLVSGGELLGLALYLQTS